MTLEGGNAMITEIVDIEVKPGEEAAFEAAVAQAIPVFRRSKGCRGVELARTIERRTKYRLFVKWETLEDHTVTFRGSENFQDWPLFCVAARGGACERRRRRILSKIRTKSPRL
jgi:heme-degrading monooxygenase HmoA